MAKRNADVPSESTIADLQDRMESGKLSSEQLVNHYLERIVRLDKGKLNSVLEVNPDAVKLARASDAERAQGKPRGALHGIPVLVKDNIDTADKLHTTAGSLALKGSIASGDAFLVTRLRDAGAIILGKTNMTEWANFISTNMPNGYSSRGGQVKNPYGEFDVGGSSSGSGASIAANLAVVAVGTETSGSILSPAVNNSLVGLKPTLGLISRRGIIPIAASQDTAGPMTRTVADTAALLNVLAGVDSRDAATKDARIESDYTDFLSMDGLRGVRLGIPRAYYWNFVKPDQKPVLDNALEALRQCGAILIDNADIPTAQDVADLGYAVLLYEFKRDLGNYLKRLEPKFPRSLLEVIRLNEAHPKTYARYGQTLMLAAQATGGLQTEVYIKTRADDLRLSRQKGIDATLKQHKLDALVMPMYWGAQIGAKAGYPTITVPVGYAESGQPIGISLLGAAWSEGKLIRMAYALEQAMNARKSPELT
jgi:amidase